MAMRLNFALYSRRTLSPLSPQRTFRYFLYILQFIFKLSILTFNQCGASRHFEIWRVSTSRYFSLDSEAVCRMTCSRVIPERTFVELVVSENMIVSPFKAEAAKASYCSSPFCRIPMCTFKKFKVSSRVLASRPIPDPRINYFIPSLFIFII